MLWYSLEVPEQGATIEYPQCMFCLKIRKMSVLFIKKKQKKRKKKEPYLEPRRQTFRLTVSQIYSVFQFDP